MHTETEIMALPEGSAVLGKDDHCIGRLNNVVFASRDLRRRPLKACGLSEEKVEDNHNMEQHNGGRSVPECATNAAEQWVIGALKIAEQEINRLRRLGWIPYTLDVDDLRSEANEIVAQNIAEPAAHLRHRLRMRLIGLLRHEFRKQRQTLPPELLPQASPPTIGAIEFHQLTACLTTKQLEVVNLIFLCGETETSAAELLGVSRDSVADRLAAALNKMRNIFATVPTE